MKKLCITTLLALSAMSAFAQPQFTSGDFFSTGAGVGDTFRMGIISSPYQTGMAMAGNTGSGHTWDFTNTHVFYAPSSLDYSCPTPNPIHYTYFPPGTNLKEYSGTLSVDNLYQKLSDTVYMTRNGTSTTTGTYMCPKIRCMTFPLNYGDSFGVTQTQYMDTNLALSTFTRTHSYMYDGFGTVNLPWGSYSNVFRIKMTIRDSSHLAANYFITYSAYYFFRQGDGIPLVRLISTCLADSVNHAYGMVARKGGGTNSVYGIPGTGNTELYPNPAQQKLYISNELCQPVSIVITDMLGKTLVTAQSSDKTAEVSLAGLTNGVYMVTVFSEDKNVLLRRKVVKAD